MSEATSAGPPADHNLLYVLLALQMDFVTRDSLLPAMQAWLTSKDRSLAEVLEELGTLTPGQRQILDRAASEHLNGLNDNGRSDSGSVELPPTVADVFQSPVSSDPAENLFDVHGPATPNPASATAAGRMRYRVLRLLARGGLGMVSVARDGELGREVALKELDVGGAGNEVSRRRFVREATITGGLEHPGIVPVYGLGRYSDGRPYYAMRLIRGESLQEAVDKLHLGKHGYTLRALLARFLAVCNTVAYAHSRGVIHRDLKPANVMLGPYGETLVVDWGLAKAIGRPPGASDDETVSETALQPRNDHAATQAGSALGTPAYMSPEQAAGRLDEQSIATDVYGLGATLYAILTGQAPVAKSEAVEVLERVRRGDWPAPRQVKASVPRPLDAVCRKAMALQPADRYSTAMALAADVEHWLAGEPVEACRDPWLTRSHRWLRRHKSAVTVVLAVVTTAAIGLVAGLVAVDREKERARLLERQIVPVLHLLEAGNRERGNQPEQAARAYRDAITLLEQLTTENPTPETSNLFASTLRDLASLYRERHEDEEAKRLLQKAVELSREIVKAAPDITRFRETLLDNVTRLAETQTALGEHAAASDTALLAIAAGFDPVDGANLAARVLSRCLLAAAYDANLSEAERTRLYADRAMEMLRQATTKGYKKAPLMNDPDFAPLRSRADFKQLATEMDAKSK
jgi:serine/threonine protein kinase